MSRKVLITTLPLDSNYGGILQAYALQRVVRDLGYRPVTDTSRPRPRPWWKRLRWFLLKYPYRWVRMSLPPQLDWDWRASRLVTVSLRGFIARNIRTASFMDLAWTPRRKARLARRFRTFVVGSDQVWRAAYADIPAQFLTALPPNEGDHPRRISYAASFGVDGIAEYSADDRACAAELIQRFDAVSVRERSGVRICRDEFGVRAERHVDPTLLLPARHYREIVSRAGGSLRPATGRMLVYRLDANEDFRRLEAVLGEQLSLSPLSLLTPWPPSHRAYAADPTRYVRPSVEHWLASFASADFVVTDSFHGCVFSILFNRPFVVFTNVARGATRIDSLLEVVGLEHHRVEAGAVRIDDRVFTPDWDTVNRVLDSERARGLLFFLEMHL